MSIAEPGAGKPPPSRRQKIKRWFRRHTANIVLPALAVVATAVAGAVAAVYADGQIRAADEQKLLAQEQELLTVVLAIEQEPVAEVRATAHLKGGLLTSAKVQFQNELTSYAQTAQLIIGGMPPKDVSGFAYVQVGKALAASGNNVQALADFQDAAKPGNTADTRAAALRNEASVRYSLGQSGRAHQEELAAVHAFGQQRDLTETNTDNNEAQSYLSDASYQIARRDCQRALADQQGAQQVLTALPDRRRTETQQVRDLARADRVGYRKHCPG